MHLGRLKSKRRIHSISWNNLCKPKSFGGLGMRKSYEMSRALLAKLEWWVLTHGEANWCKLVRMKYDTRRDGCFQFVEKQRSSRIWKGIIWGSDILRLGARRRLGNRKSINFWRDIWLTDTNLLLKACSQPDVDILEWLVVDTLEVGRGWKWELFAHLLPFQHCWCWLRFQSTQRAQSQTVLGGWK